MSIAPRGYVVVDSDWPGRDSEWKAGNPTRTPSRWSRAADGLAADVREDCDYFRRWHTAPEGKAAIYGTLTLAVATLAASIISHILRPDDLILPGVKFEFRPTPLVMPCKIDEQRYLYGFRIVVYFGGDHGPGVVCRNIGEKWRWHYDVRHE